MVERLVHILDRDEALSAHQTPLDVLATQVFMCMPEVYIQHIDPSLWYAVSKNGECREFHRRNQWGKGNGGTSVSESTNRHKVHGTSYMQYVGQSHRDCCTSNTFKVHWKITNTIDANSGLHLAQEACAI